MNRHVFVVLVDFPQVILELGWRVFWFPPEERVDSRT